jgi:four helix bundle protein
MRPKKNLKSGEIQMLNDFRCYQLSKQLYHGSLKLKFKGEVKDQLQRALLSICLNLCEGAGKATAKDRRRFFQMALGSTREVQALLDLHLVNSSSLNQLADRLGASIWQLIQRPGELKVKS